VWHSQPLRTAAEWAQRRGRHQRGARGRGRPLQLPQHERDFAAVAGAAAAADVAAGRPQQPPAVVAAAAAAVAGWQQLLLPQQQRPKCVWAADRECNAARRLLQLPQATADDDDVGDVCAVVAVVDDGGVTVVVAAAAAAALWRQRLNYLARGQRQVPQRPLPPPDLRGCPRLPTHRKLSDRPHGFWPDLPAA